jgi:hypothetical protein
MSQMKREELAKHKEEMVVQHLELVTKALSEKEKENEVLSNRVNALQEVCEKIF